MLVLASVLCTVSFWVRMELEEAVDCSSIQGANLTISLLGRAKRKTETRSEPQGGTGASATSMESPQSLVI